MSISRLQASLAQATNEVTVAAANINFDFCLVKYEVPKEYRPVGELLSTSRKQDAEHGTSHVTARRMAALFDGICPETPSLIKAYGERVSEISRQATTAEAKARSASMFGSYVGVDATSIWAAATSSQSATSGAIHLHFLACLLALMFDAAEAISIWVELVEERRKAVARSWERDEAIPFSMAAAAVQQGISRQQLAEWDSSARAWLQTADFIMAKKQTQLQLILKNVNLSMGSEISVYLSVIDAWKKTLATMERLVSGVPQEVQDGSAILGLAAWHIYPDIVVFGSRNAEIYMQDPLVAPGGILSLGCSPSATTPRSGVSWSLSLAQLKYYGQPVMRQGRFKPDPTRITFQQLMLVTIGCILSRWNVPTYRIETEEGIKFISLLSRNTVRSISLDTGNREHLPVNFKERVEGAQLLAEAASRYFQNREEASPFVNLGRSRTSFLPPRTYVAEGIRQAFVRPFLNLDKVEGLMQSIRDANGRIEFLRRIAARTYGLADRTCIIQYTDSLYPDTNTVGYATVFPRHHETEAGEPLHSGKRTTSHGRWLNPNLMELRVLGETLHENKADGRGFTASSPPRMWCMDHTKEGKATTLRLWFGDWNTAAIYVNYDEAQPPPQPKITTQDILWCLEHDIGSTEDLLYQNNDSVVQTMECLAFVHKNAFHTISEPVIQVQVLEKSLIDTNFIRQFQNREYRDTGSQASPICKAVSILSYLVAGHDILHSKIPSNVVGISSGNSIFVPDQLLCDPAVTSNRSSFTRILGNIGKPGFVMFFSVESPTVSPQDHAFWRVSNPGRFDGQAIDLFRNTSMHLSFTNWERPIEDLSSRGNQDVQMALMESVISIREGGRWVGDVDVLSALKSSLIYRLPPQNPCSHSKSDPLNIEMKSIESWDELRELHAGNVVIRANGNWLARLATTAYLSQHAEVHDSNVRRITLCPSSVCWKCIEGYAEQFPANIYVY